MHERFRVPGWTFPASRLDLRRQATAACYATFRKRLGIQIKERRGSKMDSFTVAPELKGTKGDIIAARIEVPILVVMIYGIVEFIRPKITTCTLTLRC